MRESLAPKSAMTRRKPAVAKVAAARAKPAAASPRLANTLLGALDAPESARLSATLEPVRLRVGDAIGAAGHDGAWFPCSGIVAISFPVSGGRSTAVALVGSEGVVGLASFMGGVRTSMRAEVVVAGDAWCLPADTIARECALGGRLPTLVLCFAQALTTQVAQTAVCNRHHAVPEQLCRWLLLAFDRVDGRSLRMTQEAIAGLMGVRREGVTEAAVRLQAAGVIRYSRGLIHLADRAGLESRACECHGVGRREYQRLLPRRLR
jgi:CRP-like cAMP-binding protein